MWYNNGTLAIARSNLYTERGNTMTIAQILKNYDIKKRKRDEKFALWSKDYNEKLAKKIIVMWTHGKTSIKKDTSLGLSLDVRDDSLDEILKLYDFRIIEKTDFFQIVRDV